MNIQTKFNVGEVVFSNLFERENIYFIISTIEKITFKDGKTVYTLNLPHWGSFECLEDNIFPIEELSHIQLKNGIAIPVANDGKIFKNKNKWKQIFYSPLFTFIAAGIFSPLVGLGIGLTVLKIGLMHAGVNS